MRTLAAAPILTAGCSGGSGNSGAESLSPSKYDRTWQTAYSEPTCADWRSGMTEAERRTAAADMFTCARNKGDCGTGLPSDALVNEFAAGMMTPCGIDTANTAEIGAALYVTQRDRYQL